MRVRQRRNKLLLQGGVVTVLCFYNFLCEHHWIWQERRSNTRHSWQHWVPLPALGWHTGVQSVSPELTRAVGLCYRSAKSESVYAHCSSGAGRANSGQLARCMALRGGGERLLHTHPVWDLWSQCRVGARLFHFPSSPISITAVSVTFLEIQNKMQGLKTPRDLESMLRLLTGQNLCCFSWVTAVTWVGQTELLQML